MELCNDSEDSAILSDQEGPDSDEAVQNRSPSESAGPSQPHCPQRQGRMPA